MKLKISDYGYAIATGLFVAWNTYRTTSSLVNAIIAFILGFLIVVALTWIWRGIKEKASKLRKREH
ncbi:MAG: hypothetical protein QXQ91_04045 [Nanopusillaceae archaeon]